MSTTSPPSASRPGVGPAGGAAVVGDATPDALDAHARLVLAPAKLTKDYLGVPELPMTPTGKVRRDALTDLR